MKKLTALLLCLCLTAPLSALAETVVTSFFPIYLFALNLCDGAEGLEVHNLTAPNTGCLHDYQLSTTDMKALSGAGAFLINGAGMEGYLDFAMQAFPQLYVVDASAGIELLDGAEEEERHGHEHELNAHIWLSPENAQMMVRNLAEGLMEAFPAQAEGIAANRDAYLARLKALDETLHAGLDELPRKEIITFHEAFPYFAQHYGLHVAAVMTVDPDEAISVRALSKLVQTVKSLNNPPLFTEPLYESAAARAVAAETGAKVFTLNPIVSGPAGDLPLDWYEACMLENMRVLQEALGE